MDFLLPALLPPPLLDALPLVLAFLLGCDKVFAVEAVEAGVAAHPVVWDDAVTCTFGGLWLEMSD
jgi:hypothetical protein